MRTQVKKTTKTRVCTPDSTHTHTPDQTLQTMCCRCVRARVMSLVGFDKTAEQTLNSKQHSISKQFAEKHHIN